MKKLPAIPNNILQRHEKSYFDPIKTALNLIIKGKYNGLAKQMKTIIEDNPLDDDDIQHLRAIRNLFIKHKLLTAKAETIRTVVEREKSSISPNVLKLLAKVFDYSQFREGRCLYYCDGRLKWKTNDTGWGGYEFLQYHARTLKYCPYCNADTVYAFEKGNHKKVASALDHFYPQSKYPFLALSLYNLVPVCSRCNSQMKGDADMTKVANPYIEDMHQNVCFFPILPKASPSLDDPCHIAVLPRKKAYDPRAKEFVRLFALERLYSSAFAGDALLCMERVRLCTPEFKRFMASFIGAKDPRMVDILLFGAPPDESKINQTRLGKMTLDIVERFGGFC